MRWRLSLRSRRLRAWPPRNTRCARRCEVDASGGTRIRELSGRGPGHPGRPPIPPYVRFRIRRFMKHAGGAAPYRAATPAPDGRTRTWERPRSYATHRRSTTGHARFGPSAMPVPSTSPAASGCASGLTSVSIAATPGIAHPRSRLCASGIRHRVPYTYRTLHLFACSSHDAASYPLPVRRASALPPASFRFPGTQDTLAGQLTFPRVGQVEDFHLQVSAPCRAHERKDPRELPGVPASRFVPQLGGRGTARRMPMSLSPHALRVANGGFRRSAGVPAISRGGAGKAQRRGVAPPSASLAACGFRVDRARTGRHGDITPLAAAPARAPAGRLRSDRSLIGFAPKPLANRARQAALAMKLF